MSARIAIAEGPGGRAIFGLDGRALLFLFAVGLMEVALYATHPNSSLTARASNDWYGWWDQGQYFKSARAFAAGDLAPESHWYAPGYALLAAVFVPLLPRNPFLLVNLASFLIFAGAFLAYFRPILGYWPTVVAFLAGLLIPPVIWVPFQLNVPFWTQFAIPWNTVPIAAAYMAILLMIRRLRNSGSPGLDLALGASAGLVAVTRPIDIVPLVLVAMAYVWHRIVLQRRWINLAIGAGGACLVIGPVIALSLAVHGGIDMPYVKASSRIGLSIVDLPERAFAILLDASTTFGEPLSLFRAAPLLFVAVPLSFAWAFLDRRNGLLPIAVAAASILTYLAYNDFGPHNIFRFLLVHYIVWTVPVFLAGGLAGFLLLARRQRWIMLGLLACRGTAGPARLADDRRRRLSDAGSCDRPRSEWGRQLQNFPSGTACAGRRGFHRCSHRRSKLSSDQGIQRPGRWAGTAAVQGLPTVRFGRGHPGHLHPPGHSSADRDRSR